MKSMIWRNNFPTSALKLLKNQPISNHHIVKISDWKVRSIFTNNVNKVDNTDFSKIKRKMTSKSSDNSKFLKDLKVPDLKAELKKRGLPVSGERSVLVERLKTHLEKCWTNVENYDFKPKEVPKNVEETQKKSKSVTGNWNTV